MDGVTDEEVMGAALAMDSKHRAELTHRLIESLDEEPEEQLTEAEWEAEWAEEAERRLAEMRAGRVQGIPGEQAFASIRALLRP